MSLIVSTSNSTIHPIEEGSYPARCIWVVDLGTQQTDFGPKKKVLIGWEIPEMMRVYSQDSPPEPAQLSKYYTACLQDKSNLRRDLESWRGRAFSAEELRGFDLAKLISAPALLTVCHRISKTGDKRASVAGVAKLPKALDVLPQMSPSRLIDLCDLDYTALTELPAWIREQVEKSQEWTSLSPDNEVAF